MPGHERYHDTAPPPARRESHPPAASRRRGPDYSWIKEAVVIGIGLVILTLAFFLILARALT
jgi:hypothetical protein